MTSCDSVTIKFSNRKNPLILDRAGGDHRQGDERSELARLIIYTL